MISNDFCELPEVRKIDLKQGRRGERRKLDINLMEEALTKLGKLEDNIVEKFEKLNIIGEAKVGRIE